MKKITANFNFINFLLILFFIFVFCFILGQSYGYLDPDLGWHLKVGEQILTEKKVPSLNLYNFVLTGKHWVDHEWLSNAILFYLYINSNNHLLAYLFTAISVTTLFLLLYTAKKYFRVSQNNSIILILLFLALGIMGSLPHWGVRLQELTMLFMALLLLLIYQFEKTQNLKLLWFLPALFYLWACLHGGFPIGLAILSGWIMVKLIELIIGKLRFFRIIDLSSPVKAKKIIFVFFFLILSVLATVLTPYGIKLYEFLLGYKDPYYLTHILEWLPINFLPIQYWKLFYIAFVIAAIMLNLIESISPSRKDSKQSLKNRINLWQISLSLIFTIMAVTSRRHFPLLFVATFPYLVSFYTSFLDLDNIKISEKLFKYKYFNFLIVLLLTGLITVKVINLKPKGDPFVSFCNEYPCAAVDFLKKNPSYWKLKMFNEYNWGGYLIWTLPEMKLFIDGRMPQYIVAGHSFMEEYHQFYKKNQPEKKLNEYAIELVFLKSKDMAFKPNWFERIFLGIDEKKLNNNQDYLKKWLEKSNGWKKIFSDEKSEIYLKNN